MKKTILCCLILCLIFQFAGITSVRATSSIALHTDDSKASLLEMNVGDQVGVQFCANATFNSISLNIRKVYQPHIEAAGVRLSLYKWDLSYYSTVSRLPVATQEYMEIQKGTYSLSSEQAFDAGEYLFVFESIAGTWNVSSYSDDMSGRVRGYFNDYEANACYDVFVETLHNTDFLSKISDNVAFGNSLNPDPSQWVAVDGLGRSLDSYGNIPAVQKDKYVGVFYWDTNGYWSKSLKPKSIQQLLDSVGEDVAEAAKNDYNHSIWSGNHAWFWDEPLLGYYSTNDTYVIRKHAELLADADVDVIFLDFSHTSPERHSYMTIFEVFEQARSEGVRTPDIAFFLPMGDRASCATLLQYLYENFYSKELYKDLWFYYEGKPLILAYPEDLGSVTDGDVIKNFFIFRRVDAFNFRTTDHIALPEQATWGWLSDYPQTKYYNDGVGKEVEEISVGVAQNVDVVAHKPTCMNGTNVAGRSYVVGDYSYSYWSKLTGNKVNVTTDIQDSVLYGLNFQQQWDYAIAADPTFIFVTGWNEWTAGRYKTFSFTEVGGGITQNAFVDQYNAEYSRDIEPSAGILKDYYYYQLVANIRRFKGVDTNTQINSNKTIDISGSIEQWDSISSFDHYVGSTRVRHENGFVGFEYDNTSMRNDIIRAKVAYDYDNVYFYVETLADLSNETDPAWMRLFIDTEFNGTQPNWEGFEYVINRLSPNNGQCVVERSCGTGEDGTWLWEEVGKVSYTVSEKVLQIAVPKKLLNLSDGEMAFNFKWSDNMQNDGDILDFYQNGDVAPGGRFMFHFQTAGYVEA